MRNRRPLSLEDHETAVETPLGWAVLGWTDRGLSRLRFVGSKPDDTRQDFRPAWVEAALADLRAYLEGHPVDLSLHPLDLAAQTPFASRVLEALHSTRPGETLPYGELARRAGSPGAARAVGGVMARNPLPLFVPCHRVVASNGPGGFSLFTEGLPERGGPPARTARECPPLSPPPHGQAERGHAVLPERGGPPARTARECPPLLADLLPPGPRGETPRERALRLKERLLELDRAMIPAAR